MLAAEGGRTSRGSIGNMREYVALLNRLHAEGSADLDAIEAFWIARVQDFFAAKPFRIRLDASRSLRTSCATCSTRPKNARRRRPGVYYAGAVMQHMVGAKLDCALGPGSLEHNSYSTSDQQSGRKGDFFLGDVGDSCHDVAGRSGDRAVPGQPERRLSRHARHRTARPNRRRGAGGQCRLGDRIDVFEIEQFIALNLYELGRFAAEGRRVALSDFVTRYNEIVDDVRNRPESEDRIQAIAVRTADRRSARIFGGSRHRGSRLPRNAANASEPNNAGQQVLRQVFSQWHLN